MSFSKISTGFVWVGSLAILFALCALPAAFEKNADHVPVELSVVFFSLGAVIIAIGMYVKARALQDQAPKPVALEESNAQRRGGCDLCGGEIPVVECKVHQLDLCGNCLARHFDYRSCSYIPTSKASSSKSARGMAAKARGF